MRCLFLQQLFHQCCWGLSLVDLILKNIIQIFLLKIGIMTIIATINDAISKGFKLDNKFFVCIKIFKN